MTGSETPPNSHSEPSPLVLAIDPGRSKCGYALVRIVLDSCDGNSVRLLQKGIVATDELTSLCQKIAAEHPDLTLIMGGGTGSGAAREALHTVARPVHLVDEKWTTQRARDRYFLDHPPRSWRRLIPRGLLSPPGPVDDYAALLLAEDWAQARRLEMSLPPPVSAGPTGQGIG